MAGVAVCRRVRDQRRLRFTATAGLAIDINLDPDLVLTPNVAAGYFARGNGTDLGSWMEFRSGAELPGACPT